jgi:transposase InsO family protein
MSNNTISIPKLQGTEDFPQWKRRAMALLQDKDYDTVINYDFKSFDPLQDAPEVLSADKHRLDLKARGLIELNVSDSVLRQLVSEQSSHAYWIKLHALYQGKSLSSIVCHLRSLLLCTQAGRPAQEFIGLIEQRARELSSAGIELPEKFIAALIICNLDSQLAGVATVLDSQDIETISLTRITALLMNEESRRNQEQSYCQANYSSKRNERRGTCRVHPHLGHSDDECYSQHPELRPRNWTPKVRHTTNDKPATSFSSSYISACKASLSQNSVKSSVWHIDTGCSNHMTFDLDCLDNFSSNCRNELVQLGDNSIIESKGIGECSVSLGSAAITLNDVLAVPALGKNLFSPGQAASSGLKFLISDDFMTIYEREEFTYPSGNIIARIRKSRDNLYRFDQQSIVDSRKSPSASFAVRRDKHLPMSIWHARLAHTNNADIMHLSQKDSSGIKIVQTRDQPSVCEPCIFGKMTRRPFKLRDTVSRSPGELIVSDLMGPFPTECVGGYKYFVTFTDRFSRFCTVALLRRKNEQFDQWKQFEAKFRNQHQVSIKEFQSDNGGEYLSANARDWFQTRGIHHRTSVPGDSESNGLAERMNRTLTDMALCMLSHSKLPQKCFPWAILAAVHIYNRRPHSSHVSHDTPYEILFKKTPNLHYLRVFGCVAYAHIHDNKRKKTQPRAQKLIHIGYASNQRAYVLYDPIREKEIVSRDVEFDENNFSFGFQRGIDSPCSKTSHQEQLNNLMPAQSAQPSEEPDTSDAIHDIEVERSQIIAHEQSGEENDAPVRRSQRVSRPPADWWNIASANKTEILTPTQLQSIDKRPRPDLSHIIASSVHIPNSVHDALQGPYAGHWFDAMQKEYGQMQDFQTWELQDLPPGRKAIACRWVFNVKPSLNGDGFVRKFKARLVVKGFSQRAGIDYNETFSPVAHQESFRIILALAAQHGLFLRQIDVVGAFLNGQIEDEIFMNQPEGFIMEGNERQVCKLKKALYGLKQAGMIWNQNLDDFLINTIGFRRTRADPCIYHFKQGNSLMILGVHVDDILLAHNNNALCDDIVAKFSKKWDITDLGEPSQLLGMHITRDGNTGAIKLSQHSYIEELLTKFNMEKCKPVSTPHQAGLYLTTKMCPTEETEALCMKKTPYAELVGSLNWLSTNTRPDIATSVGTLCRFISNPGKQTWKAALRVLSYLSGTLDRGVTYKHQAEGAHSLQGYSDADWAGDPDTRRSTTGYVFTFAGGPIAWKSKLQKSSALSSVEAEYIAACSTSREAKWIRQLLAEIEFPITGPVMIFEDNQGCISISSNNRTDSRTKHIDVKYHFVRDMIQKNMIELKYIPTERMLADFLTKPTTAAKFNWCCAQLFHENGACLRGPVKTQSHPILS